MYSQEELSRLCHQIHQYPEPGWCEFVTTARLVKHLMPMGLEVLTGTKIINPKYVAGRNLEQVNLFLEKAREYGVSELELKSFEDYTGCVAILKTGRPGPVLAIRCDIDCVEVSESTDPQHRPAKEGWASQNEGCMHSCGHDAHQTIGIGLCSWLADHRDELCGTIKVLFQPAEEGVRGARPMAESGILDDVDYFFASHIGIDVPTGKISAHPGCFLASKKLDAVFTGKASHAGANAERGRNALLAASTAALAVTAIARHGQGRSAVNVGTLHAGEGRNVIASTAKLQLEVRGETEEINSYMYEEAVRRLEGAATMYGCTLEILPQGEATEFNPDEKAILLAEEVANEIVGKENTARLHQPMGSEDATIMLKRVQSHGGIGTYLLFGSDLKAGHHQNLFDFDEKVIGIALRFYEALVSKISGVK
ncbi:MAG: amidohydrolase [Burkholderiaceae bacterium]|nr:amidohydrolase [Burkholderiaceae bacterium]